MIKDVIFLIATVLFFHQVCAQRPDAIPVPVSYKADPLNMSATNNFNDSVNWIHVSTDSGMIHAAIITPKGKGPFPAVVILHGSHGFAQEYIQLARQLAKKGIVGIAACNSVQFDDTVQQVANFLRKRH